MKAIKITLATAAAALAFAGTASAHYGDYNTQYNVTQNAAFNQCQRLTVWCPAGFHLESHGVYSTHSRYFVWSWWNSDGGALTCLYELRIDHSNNIFTYLPGSDC